MLDPRLWREHQLHVRRYQRRLPHHHVSADAATVAAAFARADGDRAADAHTDDAATDLRAKREPDDRDPDDRKPDANANLRAHARAECGTRAVAVRASDDTADDAADSTPDSAANRASDRESDHAADAAAVAVPDDPADAVPVDIADFRANARADHNPRAQRRFWRISCHRFVALGYGMRLRCGAHRTTLLEGANQ